ncbi:MAG TPA: acyl-CoA thioester hydrolase/BAAT C-terminal domain-containing protein [Thermoanaerobaculaceae bacterium]|nr:acyl-CoA thioester hydrolase/BAAT C-terminal domain-containing protein [Thermoanaerobaculaceae bacterium]
MTPPPPLFWGDLAPGRYAVGFRVLYLRDPTRPWSRDGGAAAAIGRPVRVYVWYPGAKPGSQARPMPYGAYLASRGPSGFRELETEIAAAERASWLADLAELTPHAKDVFDRLAATPTAAYWEGAPAGGAFPLVLYASGKAARSDAGAVLAEYLASHGYVVATLMQIGPAATNLELGSSPPDLELRGQDCVFALGALRRLPQVDAAHLAVAGHSAGAEVALLLACRIAGTGAVVSLDGSYGTVSGARVIRSMATWRPDAVRCPILDVRRAAGSQGAELDPAVLDSLAGADRTLGVFREAWHGDFTEWATIARQLRIPQPPGSGSHTREIGFAVNQHAYRAVLAFLDGHLRNDRVALASIRDEVLAVPGATYVTKPGVRSR